MRFLTPSACDDWIATLASPAKSVHELSVQLPKESGRLLCLAQIVAKAVMCRRPCLLRVTEWEIWPSNNNWHLYYHLRQGYEDQLLMEEAAGHLFLEYEQEDFATFLHIAMLFGWDAEIWPRVPYITAKLSHDEFIDFRSEHLNELTNLQKTVADAGLRAELRS